MGINLRFMPVLKSTGAHPIFNLALQNSSPDPFDGQASKYARRMKAAVNWQSKLIGWNMILNFLNNGIMGWNVHSNQFS